MNYKFIKVFPTHARLARAASSMVWVACEERAAITRAETAERERDAARDMVAAVCTGAEVSVVTSLDAALAKLARVRECVTHEDNNSQRKVNDVLTVLDEKEVT